MLDAPQAGSVATRRRTSSASVASGSGSASGGWRSAVGSVARRPAIVSRVYRHSSDHVEHAVEMLLKSKKAAEPRKPDVPNDADNPRSGHAGVGATR